MNFTAVEENRGRGELPRPHDLPSCHPHAAFTIPDHARCHWHHVCQDPHCCQTAGEGWGGDDRGHFASKAVTHTAPARTTTRRVASPPGPLLRTTAVTNARYGQGYTRSALGGLGGGGARREEVVPRRPPLLPPCHPHAAAAPPSKVARCSRHRRKIRPLLTGRDLTGSAHPQPEHHRAPVTSLLCSATSAQALCTATLASTARLHM
jgi:hypothetical protein